MHPDDLDALAEKMAQRLAEFIPDLVKAASVTRARDLTAAELAAELGVSRDYIYQHRAELGGETIGKGSKKGRLRFDLERARAGFYNSTSIARPTPAPASRSRRRLGRGGRELLPVKDRA